jgi:hypothetical protein
VIRQNNYSQWDGPLYPQFGNLTARLQSFSTRPVSSIQDAHDLSDAGYFYTGAVIYKQEPCLLQKIKHFLVNSANTNLFLVQEKKTKQSVSISVLL